LKFTRLRLSGFKSFVEPTELIIEPGLTGVVGPNGCGKSNLLEALRWVMGENRPTSMRGSGMEDVIFAGSGSRPSRNNAEVTLVIDNADRSAPAPHNELEIIEVSRRIEREAGSVYRLNGRDVRQRDVQIFFADASTGSTSPSLVRQGQISILINQKPQARRQLLEEAAGIAGLHQRRHEAELRLRAAETNLSRLDDVIAEIEGQLQGLRRQARQATRYRSLSGHIRKAEALVFLLRWQTAEAQALTTGQAADAAAQLVGERTERAAEAATIQAQAAEALPPLRNAEATKSAALQRLLHQRDALEAEETRAREEAQRMRQRINQAEQDLQRERKLEQDAETSLAELQRENGELKEADERAHEDFAAAQTRAAELAEALEERERRLEKLTSELADWNATKASYERAANEGQQGAARAQKQIESLAPRLAAAEAEIAAAPDVKRAEAAVEDARAIAGEIRSRAEAAREQADRASAAEAAARIPLEAAEREAQRLTAEVKALADLLRPAGQDLWPPLIDSVRVTPGYESALAAALGDDLDAPLDEAAPHHWRNLGDIELSPLPAGAVPLSHFVEAPPALARRLAFTGIVSPEAGAQTQKELKPGQRLVTQRGDLWRWDGFSVSVEAPSAAAQRLEMRNRLESLEGELQLAKAKRTEIFEVYSAARASSLEAVAAAQAAEREAREKETAFIALQDAAAKAARLAAEHASLLAALQAEMARYREALENARTAEAAAREALQGLPDGTALASDLADARGLAAQARSAASEARAAVETLRREALVRAQRLQAIADDAERWAARRASAAEQIAALQERVALMSGELETLDAVPGQIAEKRSALLDAITTADEARKEAADARAEAEAQQAQADKIAKAADHALTEAREERAAADARREAAAQRLGELRTRIHEELDARPEELNERAEVNDEAELPPLDQAEARVEKLKREREQLGGVNLRAEEEAAEHEQRLQAMQLDRADLDGAIQRLRKGIQSLNQEGRTRLMEAFEKVNGNFTRLFKELFQGGEAHLTFTESEDPLEAGLEIFAKPPGKKLTTLSLLSGGEQALTAISLIFAVFMVNPAPICVLDEVDAPLDDANVDRFCRLLEEMTRLTDTRFLIITHHALTMSRMDRLFGVTMAERGVSQLVSVSLAEAERVIAAE
jgi:chromosome segregation protein